jgi:NitT/TauT family transport system permease protein
LSGLAARHPFLVRALSVAALLLVWEIVALILASRALPTPQRTFAAFLDGIASGELIYNVAITLGRVVAAFIVAMLVGSALGVAMGRWRSLDAWLDFWVLLLLNLPALVTIILCYVWFGLTETAAITAAALSKFPNVVVTMREGARTLDPGYAELARVFRFSRAKTFRQIILPQLAPFFMASARSGLAIIWKIVLVVELLGRSNGVGFQLHLFFESFDVPSILAYALVFVLIVQLIELGVIQPLERRANRWRR